MAHSEGERMISFKGVHFEKDILLTCVRWYVAYPLSYRQLEGMMQERGLSGLFDHPSVGPEVRPAV
jgi:putative transposase